MEEEDYLLLFKFTTWYRTNRPMYWEHSWSIVYVTMWVLIIPDSPTRSLCQIPTETPSMKSGETWLEMAVYFAN
jgi:hypothetical protein